MSTEPGAAALRAPPHTLDAKVLALVPHFACEEWLPACLESLLAQTQPLAGIAVIDDASERAPVDIVRHFPGVTLLQARENVGPYRLIQSVIESTGYDAYMFNDADDWSPPDRLERLLRAAQQTGAELIGSQEVRVFSAEAEAVVVGYPLDVNQALAEQPCAFPLLHPTSLVARDLVMRLGGFAAGMRFSGDAEFLRRAAHAARVVNIAGPAYFRRKRDGALTTSPETGLESPARRRAQEELWAQAVDNAARVARGEEADLTPLKPAPAIPLRRLAGPPLLPAPEGAGRVAAHERATVEPTV